ncbi:MAG: hypothetical protein Q7R47_01910 [Candidatus Diapherotrites archaeon]|nr:hypothetical protein [Candidatus Diapherotrites archaeon]
MPANPRRKIRPFQRVPIKRIPKRDPASVYLENRRIGVRIPLRNQHGDLQGAFETKAGEVLEIRASPSGAWLALIGHSKLLRPEGLTAWAVNSEPWGSERSVGFALGRTRF